MKLPVEDIFRGGNSKPRNSHMQTMLRMVGFGDNAGSGFPTIVAVWKAEGWMKPKLVEDTILNQITLKLSMLPIWMDNLQKLEQQIIANLGSYPEGVNPIAEALQTSMENLAIPKIDGIESAIKAFAQGLPKMTHSQLEQIQDSLSTIGERFKFDKTLMFDSMNFSDALVGKSAKKSAEKSAKKLAEKSAEKSAKKSAEKSAEKKELTKRHRQILGLMAMSNPYSTEQIANAIELKAPRTRQLLNELVKLGYLECTGTTKSRCYVKIK